MLFSSMSFIFLFLPVVILLSFIINKKFHNALLLIASLIFYFWGEARYLNIIFLTVFLNYIGGLAIEKYNKKLMLFVTVFLDLLTLIYFKYADFLIDIINNFSNSKIPFLEVLLPLGISFYMFQALSYIFDVYRGEVKPQKNFFKFALYICFFPQLIAGPIVKYHDIKDQIDKREVNFDKINYGIKRFIAGLAKKVLIANPLGFIADEIFKQSPDAFSHLTAWLGALSYSLQIYFDFSGYSDMAIGLGFIFGFKFMENFNYPYISKSITEFWRRWHISLSAWFKEYVYISLGGNKKGLFKTCRNLGIVFLLTGIWHGASWNFVFWGIWNGFFIVLEKIARTRYNLAFPNFLGHIYCIFVFVVGWVIFRSADMTYAISYLKNMFFIARVGNVQAFAYNYLHYFDPLNFVIFIAAILCSTPLFKDLIEQRGIKLFFVDLWLLLLFFLSTVSIAADTYNPFIYFRF